MRGSSSNWYDIIDPRAILGLPLVDISNARALADRRAIKDAFISFGRVRNARDGREVAFPAASVGKMWFNSGVDIRTIAAEFAGLFRLSVRAWSEPNEKIPVNDKRRRLEAVHQYVAKFSNQTGRYYIRFTIKENKGGKLPRAEVHASVVSNISIYKTEGAELSTPVKTQAEDSAPFVDDKIALFLSRVNGDATNITVIILIGQEKMHLKRCVEKLTPLNPRQIFLVESQPDDGGVAIAKETAAKLGLRLETVYHKWPGNQAVQFNWALDELGVGERCRCTEEVSGFKFQVSGGEGGWILRLDADEYLDEKGIEWLKANLASVPVDVGALEFTLERKFMGGVIRHATNGIKMVRMFRAGRAKYAETLMDERLIYEGKKLEVPVVFWDDNLNGLEWWKNKHRGYAKREAEQALTLFDCSDCSNGRMKNGVPLDPRKIAYYKLPRYLRAVMYFCIRYFLKGGFLDGKAGWRWNFWQGLWYRWIVDREIGRLRSRS